MRYFFNIIVTIILFFNGLSSAEGKTTYYRNSLSFAYSQVNSIFEDDNIILQIYDGKLWAKNKTDKTIFIDLSQCFLINNGSSYPMFSTATDEKKASKAKYSDSIEEFLSIAPSIGSDQNETFITNLETRIYGNYSSTENPTGKFSDYDKRFLNLIDEMLDESLKADPKGKNYYGTVMRHLTEDESINNIGASIAYAFNKRAEEWTSVTISTWVSDIIFAPYYTEVPDLPSKKEQRGFGVKEIEPAKIHIKANIPFEFEEDKSPIIITDWEGNYKKGYFTLSTIQLYAEKYKNPVTKIKSSQKLPYRTILSYDGDGANWGKLKYSKSRDINQWGENNIFGNPFK